MGVAQEEGGGADERKALGSKNGGGGEGGGEEGGTSHELFSSFLRTLQIEDIHPLQPPLDVVWWS